MRDLAAIGAVALLFILASTALPAETEALRDWRIIEQIIAWMSGKAEDTSSCDGFARQARQRDELHARLLRFLQERPDDDHWREATFHLLMRPPVFLVRVDPARFRDIGPAAAEYDQQAVSRWDQEAARIKARFLSDPRLRDEWRHDLLRRDLYIDGRDALARRQRGETVDLAPLRERLDDWLKAFPMSERASVPIESYMRALAAAEPDAVEQEWERFARSSNPIVRELAQGQALVWRSKREPLDWTFVALDGRTVDFAKLRGKIILIDFWATWCGPCVAEMPKLKHVYDLYHDRGFEIIGVSLDSAGDRRKLEQFVAAHGMPWPQHFDGGGRRNAYAVRYGIKSVPTKLLIDQTGRVVNPRIQADDLAPALERRLGDSTRRDN